MAEFDTPTALVEAERARLEGYRNMDAYSPIPIEELSEALGLRRTRLPLLVLLGGISAGLAAIRCSTGRGDRLSDERRRPPVPQLAAVHPGHVRDDRARRGARGVLRHVGAQRLPRPYHPVFNVAEFGRASTDRFFLCIEATDPKFDHVATRRFLEACIR
jgi:hypothetical protein